MYTCMNNTTYMHTFYTYIDTIINTYKYLSMYHHRFNINNSCILV